MPASACSSAVRSATSRPSSSCSPTWRSRSWRPRASSTASPWRSIAAGTASSSTRRNIDLGNLHYRRDDLSHWSVLPLNDELFRRFVRDLVEDLQQVSGASLEKLLRPLWDKMAGAPVQAGGLNLQGAPI